MPAPINHNHLYYFWLAAKHRSLTAAARELGLAQPTVSTQIRSLERKLKTELLARRGHSIDLTEAGMIVFKHADEMFRISSEIPDALKDASARPRPLNVGTSDFVPKPVIRAILEPSLREDPALRLVCREWRIDELLAELALYQLDMVISDRPHTAASGPDTVSQPVLESPMAIFAHPTLARQLRRGFPRSLHNSPLFLPVRGTALREALDRWFQANKIVPVVLAEFEDRALLKTFGSGGLAAFPAITLIEQDIRTQFGVERVGWLRGIRETYYSITVPRRSAHPVVQQIIDRATRGLIAHPRASHKRADHRL